MKKLIQIVVSLIIMQLPVFARDVCNRPFSTPENIAKQEYSMVDINGKRRSCFKDKYAEINCEGIKIIQELVGGWRCSMIGCYGSQSQLVLKIIDNSNQSWMIAPSHLSRNGFIDGKKRSEKCVNNLRVITEATEYYIQGGYVSISEETTWVPDLRRPAMN